MPRTSRAAESRNAVSRKAEKRPMPQTADQSVLYIPPHIIPADKDYRWVSVATLGQPDHNNWARRVKGGWTPVPRSRHPDYFPTIPIPGLEQDAHKDIIVVGSNSILCERPKSIGNRERARLRAENASIIDGIKWTGQDTPGFGGVPVTDESQIGIEQVVAERTEAEFKDS